MKGSCGCGGRRAVAAGAQLRLRSCACEEDRFFTSNIVLPVIFLLLVLLQKHCFTDMGGDSASDMIVMSPGMVITPYLSTAEYLLSFCSTRLHMDVYIYMEPGAREVLRIDIKPWRPVRPAMRITIDATNLNQITNIIQMMMVI